MKDHERIFYESALLYMMPQRIRRAEDLTPSATAYVESVSDDLSQWTVSYTWVPTDLMELDWPTLTVVVTVQGSMSVKYRIDSEQSCRVKVIDELMAGPIERLHDVRPSVPDAQPNPPECVRRLHAQHA